MLIYLIEQLDMVKNLLYGLEFISFVSIILFLALGVLARIYSLNNATEMIEKYELELTIIKSGLDTVEEIAKKVVDEETETTVLVMTLKDEFVLIRKINNEFKSRVNKLFKFSTHIDKFTKGLIYSCICFVLVLILQVIIPSQETVYRVLFLN
jgi:hypothetical protein